MNGQDQSPLLEVSELHVNYGRITAVKGVSFGVSTGEIVAILGPNGAGKSTLMKALAGLVPVQRGEIQFSGESIVQVSAYKRSSIGMVLIPEGRMIFAPLTVKENLRLGMLSDKWIGGKDLFQARLEGVLNIFPVLRDRLRTPAGDLSGGQQQMVAIGRGLMSDPKLLLLDEPSLGLAPRVIEDLFRTILALNEEHEVTVLLAEQSIDNALAIADRAYVLQLGEVALSDSAEALLEQGDLEDVYLGRKA
jgi:branched-chain amino acid transport system ATP-binding protein